MACLNVADFRELIGGSLNAARRTSMELHIDNCLTCRTAWVSFSKAEGVDPLHHLNSTDATIAHDAGAPGSDASETTNTESGKRAATSPYLDETIASDGHFFGPSSSRATDPTDVTIGIDGESTAETIAAEGSGIASKADVRRFPRIDGYTITDVLGHGGMGVVYRAVQTKLNRTVALKVLPAIIGNANPAAVRRFRREATAAARLHHTNIIPIYDFGESIDAHYYAMELVTGRPLDSLVEEMQERSGTQASAAELGHALQGLWKDTLSGLASAAHDPTPEKISGESSAHPPVGRKYFEQLARWIRDVAEALDYAHEQGVIHRDIKPANLILSTDGRIMVADFGLAKTSDEASMTRTGAMLGTLRYASPEQVLAGKAPLDHRTDLYSLGATMYELLTFQPVFPDTEQQEIVSAILSKDPVAPRKHNAHIPRELEIICMKCLEKAAVARYETGKALADDLRRFVSDLPIVARKPTVYRRVTKFVKRHKALVAASAAAVLLIVSTLLWQRETAARKRAQIASFHDSAMALALTNRWDRAATDLRSALEINRNDIQTLLTLAWLKLEHYRALPEEATLASQEEVVRVCRQILILDPKSIKALGYLGIAQRRLARYDEAIDTLKRALELEPDAYHSWSNLGALYVVSGDLVEAERCLKKGAKLAGKERDRWHAAVWRNFAVFEAFQGREEARDHVETAIGCDSTDTLSWILRAQLGMTSDDPHVAREALDDVKHADRMAVFSNPIAKRIRGIGHLKLGEYEEALEQARLAIDLGDMPGINHLIEAGALASLGRQEEATQALAAADESWPSRLREAGTYTATVATGDLWIETAKDRIELSAIARRALDK